MGGTRGGGDERWGRREGELRATRTSTHDPVRTLTNPRQRSWRLVGLVSDRDPQRTARRHIHCARPRAHGELVTWCTAMSAATLGRHVARVVPREAVPMGALMLSECGPVGQCGLGIGGRVSGVRCWPLSALPRGGSCERGAPALVPPRRDTGGHPGCNAGRRSAAAASAASHCSVHLVLHRHSPGPSTPRRWVTSQCPRSQPFPC